MADALFLHSDLASLSKTAVTASNALAATLSAANLATNDVTEIFRVSGATTEIDLDLGSAKTARGCFFAGLGEDVTGLSTFTVSASNTAAGNTDELTFDALAGGSVRGVVDPLYRQSWADWQADVTARYWRFSLTATGAANLDIGRLFLGHALPLSVNISYPFGETFVDLGNATRMASGALQIENRRLIRRLLVGWGPASNDPDPDLFERIQRMLIAQHGQTKPIAFILDPDANQSDRQKQAVFGRITSFGTGSLDGYHQFSRRIEITEEGGINPAREF